jgi:hypothetical protein
LWWTRVDGVAEVVLTDPEALAALRERYPQYQNVALEGPVISIDVIRWRNWPE